MALTRREMLQTSGTALAATLIAGSTEAAPAKRAARMTLGFTTYGMRTLTLDRSLEVLSAIGYDAVEIDTAAGQHGDPLKLDRKRRGQIRQQLVSKQLQLRSLMMHLAPTSDRKAGSQNLERIKRTAEMSRELRPAFPPLLQTVLGGGKWEQKKNLFVDRLGKWLEVVSDAKVVLAIKPHRGGGMSRPSEAIWLIKQLGQSPYLKMVYDYSHYAHRKMPLAETIRTALPQTAHIAVKDAVLQGDRVRFDLPGRSGTFDYVPLLQQFYKGGYRGDISCEVSGQVWGQKGYQPIEAAQTCYRHLAAAFTKAGIQRS